jgi:transcriptional regulator with XRE-family HTH domain
LENNTNNDFGQYLKDRRKLLRLTLVQLSEQSGVSQPYLSQIENGKVQFPSPTILKKLTTPLDVNFTSLMVRAGYFDELENAYLLIGPRASPDLNSWINNLMASDSLYYNGHHLSSADGMRVLMMLEALFPDYVNTRENKK